MNSQCQASAPNPEALAHTPVMGLADKSAGHRGAGKGPQQQTRSNESRKYRIDKNGYG